jgi:DNA-binding response OmpR family regulator
VLPAEQFFSQRQLRSGPEAVDLLPYGPAHLFRAAWLSGAQDYLREPWQPDELFLRLKGPRPPKLTWAVGAGTLSLEGCRLAGPTDAVKLTSVEAELLRILVQRRGVAVSRAVLAWGAACSEGRAVDTLMGRLRIKVQRVSFPGAAVPEAVRGVGYRLP